MGKNRYPVPVMGRGCSRKTRSGIAIGWLTLSCRQSMGTPRRSRRVFVAWRVLNRINQRTAIAD
jgi:hypothetical protein